MLYAWRSCKGLQNARRRKGGSNMDSSMRDIPVVEGDMGEGFMDPIEEEESFLDKKQREQWKIDERLRRRQKK